MPLDVVRQYPDAGDFSELWQYVPNLRRLVIQGGEMELGDLDLPNLEHLELRTWALPLEAVESITERSWPHLHTLRLWLGAATPVVRLEALAEILQATNFPALKHLGLVNTVATDALCHQLVQAPVMAQLETLDLSLGSMTDEGAEILLASPEVFQQLQLLDVHRNALGWSFNPIHGLCEVHGGSQDEEAVPSAHNLTSLNYCV